MQAGLAWQHPHVDVFKLFKIIDLKDNIEVKGKVSVIHEKELHSKKVLKIEGQNSSSSHVKFPKKQTKSSTLGLNGNYQVNAFTLNIPINENPNKWSILGIDSKAYLSNLTEIKEGSDYQIKQMELCPNMRIKNIYTSNLLYCLHSIPKDLQFTTNPKIKFSQNNQFIMLGDKTWQENKEPPSQENIQPTKPKKDIKNQYGKEYLRNVLSNKDQNFPQISQQEKIKEDEPRIEPHPFILEQRNDQELQQIKKKEFTLEPTPIMQIQHVQGYTGGINNLVKFGPNSILYSTGNIMVQMDMKTRVQTFYFSQHSNINNIAANYKNNIIVTTDQTQISIWNAQTIQRTGFFYTGYSQILSMDICIGQNDLYIALAALDNQKRPAIMVLKNENILVKQISDFNIKKLKFIDNQDLTQGFVAIGKESIRYWKLKQTFDSDYVLNGHSVFLGEHTRNSDFTDLCIQNQSKKALIVSNEGNLFISDIQKQEIIGVYQIHEENCKTIQICQPNPYLQVQEEYIITGDNQGRVKIWTSDFNDVILEVKLDSQISAIQIYDERLILCGCLNGTLGILDKSKKIFNYLVRSHNDDVIMLKYHNHARKVISISADFTIRIWEIMGSNLTLFFSEVYEFRCLDDQVSTIACFNTKEKIICGFESGNIRVFDIKNYLVTYEMEFHSSKVTSIAMNFNDQCGISADNSGKICLFNEELQLTKSKEANSQFEKPVVGFNFKGDLYYILDDWFNLKIYSLQKDVVKFWVSTQEKIMNVCFSKHKEDFFVITDKGKIKKYKLNENTNDIKLYRQYAAMHEGHISSITPSSNCNYLITTGEDQMIKVWDYNFRGGLQPTYQAYNCGEELTAIELTNDDLNLVLSFGQKSRTLFCWKFKTSLYESDENDYNSEMGDMEDQAEINNIVETKVFSNLTKTMVQGNYTEQQDQQEARPIQDIYQNEQNMFGINNNKLQYQQDNDTQEESKENKYNKMRQINQESQGEQTEQNEDQIIKKEDILPGEYIQKQYVIGFDNELKFPQQQLIWNQQQEYYILTCNQDVVVNNLTEERNQKIFQEDYKVGNLTLSQNNKFFVYSVQNEKGSVKMVDAKSLKTIKTINHDQCQKIDSLILSPCSNYLLTVTKVEGQQNQFLTIFEIVTSRIISYSQLDHMGFVQVKWDCSEIGNLEFTVLFEDALFFYRLTQRQNLEYIEQHLDKQQKTQAGILYCCEYLELNDKQLLLVGSQNGTLLIHDINTASLLCICRGIINGPITQIVCNTNRLVIYGSTINIYFWNFENESSQLEFLNFAKMIEIKPETITLDSVTTFICQKQAEDQAMVISRQGVLWLIDFSDKTTLRLNASHASQRKITKAKYIVNSSEQYHNGIIFSASNDYTLKLFNMGSYELKSEFYSPKKDCLTFDVIPEYFIVCGGYNDGYIRFFQYEQNVNLGVVLLVEPKQNKAYPVTTVVAIPQTRNFLVGNSNGDIYMVYIKNLERNKFSVDINYIFENVGFCVNQICISYQQPLDLWLITTQNGKIMVLNRKCLKRNIDPQQELAQIYDLEYYLTDNYKILKHQMLQQEKSNYFDNVCQAEFSKDDKDIYFAISTLEKQIVMRNFREHLNIKVIPIKFTPMYIQCCHKNDCIIVSDKDGGISIYDYQTGLELDREIISMGQSIQSIQFIDNRELYPGNELIQENRNDPNQPFPPYLIATSQNQISVYNIFI